MPLAIWARYDYTQPVAVPVLEKFLFKRSPNFVFYFVPDVFHPKVIWWHGYGAYIGSANLSRSAWSGNIEAGLFLTEDELANHGISGELSNFFDEIRRYEHPLTQELLNEVNRFTFKDPMQNEIMLGKKRFAADRLLPTLKSLISVDRKPTSQRNREEFLKEWNSTLETLRMIASRVVDYRPQWIEPNAPTGTRRTCFFMLTTMSVFEMETDILSENSMSRITEILRKRWLPRWNGGHRFRRHPAWRPKCYILDCLCFKIN